MAEVNKTEATAKKVETKEKVLTFKCVTTCYWNSQFFNTGDIMKCDSTKDVPRHFVLLNK